MQPDWLRKIDAELPSIIDIVRKCDDPYRLKCFELLLEYALNTERDISGSKASNNPLQDFKKDDSPKKDTEDNAYQSKKYTAFLSSNGLSHKLIENLIDFDTGEIICSKLGSKGSDITRNIAVLLAILHLFKDGELSFTTEELKIRSKAYDVPYHNQKRDIKKVTYESKKVFIENSGKWVIPIPAQPYLAKIVKELNPLE